MPVNDIIAEIQPKPNNRKDKAPEEDGRPDTEQKATTMRTPRMMPPWVHNQTLTDRSVITLIGTVLSILGLLRRVI